MRRLIHAATIAGMLIPGVAWAHGPGDEGTGAGQGDQGSGDNAGGNTAGGDNGGGQSGEVTQSDRTGGGLISDEDTTGQVPFRNSTLILDQSVTPETVAAGAQLSYVPSYQWWISARPRWYLNHDLSIRAREDLTYEWFNGSSDRTHLNEGEWGDLWTDLVYTGFPTLGGVRFSAGLRALWPISLASRMRGTYITLGAVVGASRAFNHLPGGSSLNVSISFAGSHAFSQYTNGGVLGGADSTYGCGSLDESLPTTCDSTGGPMNSAFNLLSIFSADYTTPVHGLSVSLFYLLNNAWAYNTPDATIMDQTGGTTTVAHDSNDTRMRQLEWFLVSLDYELTKWVTMSVGYYCYRPVLDPDSTYGNPFWEPGGTSRVFFEAVVSLDGVYNTLVPRSRPTPTAQASAHPDTMPTMNQIAHESRLSRLMTGTF